MQAQKTYIISGHFPLEFSVFSKITQDFDQTSNRLYCLRDEKLSQGFPILDLVSGNVNNQGIHFPQKQLALALAKGAQYAKTYKPDPLGQKAARTAISRSCAAEGFEVPAEQLILTPGTSISYWYAFKVLANPGDEILCPAPSYPLFDSIAKLCDITLVPYKLEENTRWEIYFDHLESSITSRTKAIVLISPHNPTGAIATKEEVTTLGDIAARKNIPIISDEVFSPFLFGTRSLPRPAQTQAPLVLTLNGFSKMLALPGFKIGWMAITGDPALVKKTMKTLDMISDTFLPVSEIAQSAVPMILKHSRPFQATYVATLRKRLALALSLLSKKKTVSCIAPEGGFFLSLKVEEEEEAMALRLLRDHHMLLHPGYFYEMEGNHLVMSFVSRPLVLRRALGVLS